MAGNRVNNIVSDERQYIGAVCELKIQLAQHGKDGSRSITDVENLRDQKAPSHDEFALIATRYLCEDRHSDLTKLKINSSYILEALKDVVGSHPSVGGDIAGPFEIQSPFQMLYHHWDSLKIYRDRLQDDTTRMYLALLLEFMQAELGDEKKKFDAMLEIGSVEFSQLWILFQPGDVVITYMKEYPWLLRVAKTAYQRNHGGQCFVLHCTYSCYDGTSHGEAKKIFILTQQAFAGHPSKVAELSVFPRKYLRDDQNLENELAERGRQHLSFSTACIRDYKGIAEYLTEIPRRLFDPGFDERQKHWTSFTEASRVVIDPKTYHEDHYEEKVSKIPLEALDKTLYPPFVFGFSCSSKRWCRFFLANLSQVMWRHDAFADLIMSDKQKSLLQALFVGHEYSADPRNEIEQKGKGLVVLLHGPPGSGKTLTAEYAAEITKKALFKTSMFELDQDDGNEMIEQRLKDILRLATTWKAIVLLDEADVFLEARDSAAATSPYRNANVAMFLRHLEYFSGIMILTTNRSHVFDAAVKSRIHVAISYRAPGIESRRQIWKQCLLRLPAEQLRSDTEASIDEFASAEINGREIANIVNTACSLARFESTPLSSTHIKHVLDVHNEFEALL